MYVHAWQHVSDRWLCFYERSGEQFVYGTWRGGVGVGEGIEQRRESKGEREGWEEGEG